MGSRLRDTDGAVPLEALALDRLVLGVGCRLRAMAPDPDGLREAMAAADELLGDLDRAWGDGGELDALAVAPRGAAIPVGWDTVLLLARDEAAGLEVDVAAHTATRTGAAGLPDVEARQSLAAKLVLAELMESGCVLAEVHVGVFRSGANRGIRDDGTDPSRAGPSAGHPGRRRR